MEMAWKSQDYVAQLPPDERGKLLANVTQMGIHPDTGDFMMLDNLARYRGMLVEGIQGSGKSGFLQTLIYQDLLQGRGVIVLDPHSDLLMDIIKQAPTNAVPRMYLLDPTDTDFPFGLNPLFKAGNIRSDVERTTEINRVTRIIMRVWSELESQANAPTYLEAAINALLDYPGATMVDLHRFLTDEDFRAGVLSHSTDETIPQFWQTRYDGWSTEKQTSTVGALIRRLDRLFVGKSMMRNILGQKKGLDFRGVIDRHEALLVKAPLNTMGDDARLLGTIIVSQIHQAIFSYANVVEKDRPGVSVYIDEAQAFTTEDIGELLTQGRKYGMRLTIAHQYKSQLPKRLLEAAESAHTKVYFRLTSDDGAAVARDFPGIPVGVEMTDDPLKHLLIHSHEHPVVKFWTDFYLRPLVARARSGKVEIDDKQLTWNIWHGMQRVEGYVDNPATALNHLFRECQRNGHSNMVIPQEVAMAFGNAGRKFFTQARRAGLDKLGPTPKYPSYMQRILEHGPESSDEELWRFIYCLRVTMETLADKPIGEEKMASNGQVAAILASLPTRHAWVHSGDERGVIQSLDTPPKLSDDHFQVRYHNVLRQTRMKYTVPREQLQPKPQPQPQTTVQPATSPAQLLQVKAPVVVEADPAAAVADEEEEPSPVLTAVVRKRGRPPKAKPTEENETEE